MSKLESLEARNNAGKYITGTGICIAALSIAAGFFLMGPLGLVIAISGFVVGAALIGVGLAIRYSNFFNALMGRFYKDSNKDEDKNDRTNAKNNIHSDLFPILTKEGTLESQPISQQNNKRKSTNLASSRETSPFLARKSKSSIFSIFAKPFSFLASKKNPKVPSSAFKI